MESDAACSHAPIRPSTVRQSRADAGLLKQPAGLTHVSVCCRCIECSADSHASLICQRCCTCTVLPRTLSTTPGANRTNISSRAGGCCSLMSGLSSPTAAHLLLPTRERPRMRCLSSKTPFAVTELAPRAYHSEHDSEHPPRPTGAIPTPRARFDPTPVTLCTYNHRNSFSISALRRVRVCSGGCKRTSPSPGRGGVAIACRVLVSLGGSCACQAQQHLKLAASLLWCLAGGVGRCSRMGPNSTQLILAQRTREQARGGWPGDGAWVHVRTLKWAST